MSDIVPTPRTWPGLSFRGYRFKLAEDADEIEQIERLVYRTFVVEIKQHPDPGSGRLIDKFHHKNRYLVAVRGSRVWGLVAVHDEPPFSVADAIPTPGVLERLVPQLLEVRLLAVEPPQRQRWLFGGLIWAVYDYAQHRGYQYLAISGLRERQAMYERMGFRPLGDPVLRGQAYYVPMLLRLADLGPRAQRTRDGLARTVHQDAAHPPAPPNTGVKAGGMAGPEGQRLRSDSEQVDTTQ